MEGKISPGYKQTEVGVIPEDWGVSALGVLATVERGKFSARPRNDPKFYGGNIPFLQTGDISRSAGRVTTFSQTLNAEGAKVSRVFPKGTLLFTIAANIGDVGITDFDAACPDSLVAVVPHQNVDCGWLLFELAKRKADFESLASPGAQLNINLEKLRPYLLPRPPHPEQRAIATALADVDALIAAFEGMIAKKRDLKQAAVQHLLTGKTRLPGFGHGVSFKRTDFGEIPEEWEVAKVDDVLSEISMGPFGSDIKVLNFISDGVPVLSGENIRTHVLRDGFKNFVSAEKAKSLKKAVAKRGDVVVTHRGTIGQIAYIPESSEHSRYVISQSQFRAKFIDKVSPLWVALFFLSERGSSLLLEGKGHTGVPAIAQATTTFRKLHFPLPSKAEQTAIAEVLSDMDCDLASLEAQAAKARAVKQGMMQDLLTGRVRLV